jgi:hypothetical protein
MRAQGLLRILAKYSLLEQRDSQREVSRCHFFAMASPQLEYRSEAELRSEGEGLETMMRREKEPIRYGRYERIGATTLGNRWQ